jgi:N-acetylglutamate synthase-like GNAT family acetyltransferase
MEDSEVFGAIAVQVIGLRGLMWPVAVDPSHADDEVRSSLLRSLLARANELSLRELYVLTEKDAEFFAGAGFVPISHEATPPEIHSSRDYRDWHSESMKVMRLQLVTRFV